MVMDGYLLQDFSFFVCILYIILTIIYDKH